MARLNGMPEHKVVRLALRNALAPTIPGDRTQHPMAGRRHRRYRDGLWISRNRPSVGASGIAPRCPVRAVRGVADRRLLHLTQHHRRHPRCAAHPATEDIPMSVIGHPDVPPRAQRRPAAQFLRLPCARVGVAMAALILFVVIAGPFFAPHSPSAPIGVPYATPSSNAVLGLDFLGRDILSRLLWGRRSVVGLAVAATVLAYVIGLGIGLVAGYSRSSLDGWLMRLVDVLLAFPPLLFLLVIATGVGHSTVALVVAVAITHVGGIARIVRTATLRGLNSKLRRGGRGEGRAHGCHLAPRDPTEHRRHRARRCRHPADRLDLAPSGSQLSRPRAATTESRIGRS